MKYSDLQKRARALVEVLELEAPRLKVLVIVAAEDATRPVRYAADSNIKNHGFAARLLADVQRAFEAS